LTVLDPAVLALRFRRALYRRSVRRTVVAITAVTTALIVGTLVRAGADARDRWGATRVVAVAQRDLEPGDIVDASAVEMRELPQALISTAVLESEPLGSVVRYPVKADEPLVDDRLAPHGLSGVAALVPDGHRAVSVPVGQPGTPRVQVGDMVDLLVVLPASGDIPGSFGQGRPDDEYPRQEPAFPLVPDALVIDVSELAVTIAVPRADTPRVAYSIANGIVVLALTGA
jgi:Flp pilus assembly protein CpaB